jgi:hypothetical protein
VAGPGRGNSLAQLRKVDFRTTRALAVVAALVQEQPLEVVVALVALRLKPQTLPLLEVRLVSVPGPQERARMAPRRTTSAPELPAVVAALVRPRVRLAAMGVTEHAALVVEVVGIILMQVPGHLGRAAMAAQVSLSLSHGSSPKHRQRIILACHHMHLHAMLPEHIV